MMFKIAIPIIFLVAFLAAWAAFCRNLALWSQDQWWRRLVWAFPTIVLILWRLAYYATFWIIRLTNEEINPRRIPREPIFEYLLPAAFAAVVGAIVIAWVLRGRNTGESAA